MIGKTLAMNLGGIGAVFERIARFLRFIGEFPRLAYDGESGAECIGQRGAEDKTTRLDAQNRINLLGSIARGKNVDGLSKQWAVAQQRRDILENNAGLGKIGDVSNGLTNARDVLFHGCELSQPPQTGKNSQGQLPRTSPTFDERSRRRFLVFSFGRPR